MRSDSPDRYDLNRRDRALLTAASSLLNKVAASRTLRYAEVVSVAKLQHVLSRLPLASSAVDVSVSVGSRPRMFGEIKTSHWWKVEVAGEQLSISSGGHFDRPSSGGDSFTTMCWDALPGDAAEFQDYRADLAIVPDVRSFPEGVASVDFTTGSYRVEVYDDDNPLLGESEETDEEDDPDEEDGDEDTELDDDEDENEDEEADGGSSAGPESQSPWSVIPVNAKDKLLAATIDAAEVDRNERQYTHGIGDCGFCRCSLGERGLFVDGRLRNGKGWGNMCAECFGENGAGIGPGRGQLYARQPDGKWLKVGGFARD